MAYKGVFFDLYGTLLIYGDPSSAWADWLSALHERLTQSGNAVTRALLASRCEGFFGKPAPPDQGDGFSIYERRINALCEELGVPADRSLLREAAANTIEAWERHISLDPDALPLLRELHPRKTLALVSNYDHPSHIYALLADHGLGPFFQAVVVSGEVGVAKPDPEIFFLALRQTGLQPNEVVYIGDTADDVRGARAAGLFPVRVRRAEQHDERLVSDYTESTQHPAVEAPAEHETVIRALPELIRIVG
jgi:putative hydrolase of the HAD superfamily